MVQDHMAASAGIYTLGCRVNQYESEALAEKLSDIGVIEIGRAHV